MEEERMGAGSLFLWGLLATVVGLIFGTIVQILLFRLWDIFQSGRPTFGGNGRQWLSLGFFFVMPIFNALILALEFMVYLPIRFDMLTRSRGRFDVGRHQIANLVYISLAMTFVMGWANPFLLLLTGLPIAAIGAFTIDYTLPRANRELARDGDERDQTPKA